MSKPELTQQRSRKFTIPVDPSKPELGTTEAVILIEEEKVNTIIGLMASHLQGVLEGISEFSKRPCVIVPILTGGVYVATKLSELLGRNGVEHHFEAIKYKSYNKQSKQKEPEISSFDFAKYKDFNVILVDELYDSGDTLTELHELFSKEMSSSSRIFTYVLFRKKLQNKQNEQNNTITPSYVGAYIPNLWCIGCGLDHLGTQRYLPFLAAVPKDTPAEKIPEDEIFNDDDYIKVVCKKIENNDYAK